MTSLKSRLAFSLLTLLVLLSPLAHAQSLHGPSFEGPIASAMGGAGRAAFDPAESAYLNPASLSALRSYFGSVYFATESHPEYGNRKNYGALLSDGNSDGLLPGAAGYTHNQISSGPGHDSSEDFFLAASGYIVRNLSVAISGHYVMDTFQTGTKQNQGNGTLGLMYSLSQELSFGLVGSNLGGSKDAVPERDRVLPSYGGGMSYYWQKTLQYRLDAEYIDQLNPYHRPNVMMGFESFIVPQFALRAGLALARK